MKLFSDVAFLDQKRSNRRTGGTHTSSFTCLSWCPVNCGGVPSQNWNHQSAAAAFQVLGLQDIFLDVSIIFFGNENDTSKVVSSNFFRPVC